MTTVNISLPVQLKSQADFLIDAGHYTSFSDLVRSALRQLFASQVDTTDYDAMLKEALADQAAGRTITLSTPEEIDSHFTKLYNEVSDEAHQINPSVRQRISKTGGKQLSSQKKSHQNSPLSLA